MSQTATDHAVRLRGLRKDFGRHPALRGVDLEVPRGAIVGLIGPNGAGKTTTMRILLDLMRPSSGEALVLGTDPHRGGASLRRRIGFGITWVLDIAVEYPAAG